ncbi:MAG: ATP-binding protein [Bacillota bacterium]
MEELSQHILDLSLNSLEAGATRLEILVRENTAENYLEFKVRDNGLGIADEDIPKVLDPFYTTKKNKRVGLGIPLLRDAVERCGGSFRIRGMPTAGTTVTAVFPHRHPDRAPLGDIAGTLNVLIAGNRNLHLIYKHEYNGNHFFFNTEELVGTLG